MTRSTCALAVCYGLDVQDAIRTRILEHQYVTIREIKTAYYMSAWKVVPGWAPGNVIFNTTLVKHL